MFKDILMNFLIIFIPIFFYQIILSHRQADKGSTNSQLLFGLLSGIAAVLCMMFPINVGTDFMWDLRWALFLLAFLYGGWRGGTVTCVMLLGYRLYLGGGPAFYSVVFDALLQIPLLLLLAPKFHKLSRQKKVLVGMLVSFLTYLWMMGWICAYFAWQENVAYLLNKSPLLYGCYAMLYMVAMAFAVHLMEIIFENAQIREEVARSEKLSIISELAASIAHEVRNPLTVVRGFIQLAKHTMDANNQRYMDTAIAELDRAEFIISDYLNFARPEVEAPEVVDASEKLANVVLVMNSFAMMAGVDLQARVEDENLLIYANKIKLKQVIMNLIKNAVEASASGGTINVVAFRDGYEAVIKVIDNGTGMTPEQLARLGSPFFSTKERGTGLGLLVTFRLVEAMGGQLDFQSEKGKGTEATIRMPLVPAPLPV